MSGSVATQATPLPTRRDVNRLRGVLAVAVAALLFAILAAVVRLDWGPLQAADFRVDTDLNALVAPHPAFVRALIVITTLGSTGFLIRLVALAVIVLAVRRRWRLVAFVSVTTLGGVILDPTLKLLVGRVRPVVPNPVAFGGGNSFPSGHALNSLICYGALVLVFLPALTPLGRRILLGVAGAVVVLIGASRVFLGVHFVTDVVGAWCVGTAWLGLSVYAFELYRAGLGRRVPQPLTEGIEPEARPDVKPTAPVAPPAERSALRSTAWIAIGWVFVLGVLAGLGYLVMHSGGNVLGDRSIPRWFAAHRTASLNGVSDFWSQAGNTHAILLVGLGAGAVALGLVRHWRPVVFLVVLMFGELSLFLAAAAITGRPRPEVSGLDGHLPTSAFPSGHVAATICLYTGIALLVIPATKAWWRWLTLVPAVLMPVLVAVSRLYRGMHHPTDILASVIFALAWTSIVYLALKPLGRPAPRAAVSSSGSGS
jgi:undecaprenyl-diphosphatase